MTLQELQFYLNSPLHEVRPGGNREKGTNRWNAKLTEVQIPEIRESLSNGESLSSIGRRFGVSHKTIKAISDKVTWTHV